MNRSGFIDLASAYLSQELEEPTRMRFKSALDRNLDYRTAFLEITQQHTGELLDLETARAWVEEVLSGVEERRKRVVISSQAAAERSSGMELAYREYMEQEAERRKSRLGSMVVVTVTLLVLVVILIQAFAFWGEPLEEPTQVTADFKPTALKDDRDARSDDYLSHSASMSGSAQAPVNSDIPTIFQREGDTIRLDNPDARNEFKAPSFQDMVIYQRGQSGSHKHQESTFQEGSVLQ